jgi:asparagine synthase (glutamine-hydrolysing)
MCGVNGIVALRTDSAAVSADELRRTRDSMQSRGPDGCGEWLSSDGRAGLGHRRLAIIDLSDAGSQPMSWSAGRYWIVFNGEIYNYRELRAELPDAPFRSQSDTETILALFARDGVQGLGRLRGMYALAVWDTQERVLVLARDPNGIKPLYYSSDGAHLRFASQVKALVAGGAVASKADPAGVCGFLLWGAVPEPWTVYQSVKAVPAGHSIRIDRNGVGSPQAIAAPAETYTSDLCAAIEDSVSAHLVSDVPVAVFLSAGLDSSLIATIARRHLATPPISITLRFREFAGTADDEGPLADQVARSLGTKHVERWVDREEFLGEWDGAMRAMDQPSIDGFNTYWVCKAAREAGVKVALSGLGGDELLGGYPSFRDVPLWNRWGSRLARVPGSKAMWSLFAGLRPGQPKLRGFLRHARSFEGSYLLRRGLFLPEELSTLLDPETVRLGLAAYDPLSAIGRERKVSSQSSWESVHELESALYMRNQLLRDADWASMAHSVEVRVPFVDAWLQRVGAASSFQLPRQLGKAGVVQRLAPALPPHVLRRRKTGFRIPTSSWLSNGRGVMDSRGLALRALRGFGLDEPL